MEVEGDCAVIYFQRVKYTSGSWTWGEHTISQASSYCYLGTDGGWDTHVTSVISNGRKRVNQHHSIIFKCQKTVASFSP